MLWQKITTVWMLICILYKHGLKGLDQLPSKETIQFWTNLHTQEHAAALAALQRGDEAAYDQHAKRRDAAARRLHTDVIAPVEKASGQKL